GLGHRFLRHIQRTSILLYLLDIGAPDHISAFRTLRSELYFYDPFMEKKPSLVVISKLDTLPEDSRDGALEGIRADFKKEFGLGVLPISAVARINLEELKFLLYKMLKEQ
ncbi:MAG: GTPase ObgE, partial [Candidatus Syntrophosphaera sp.]